MRVVGVIASAQPPPAILFPPTCRGTLESGIKAMLPDSQFTGGGLEFGTSPLKDVMAALRKENWLWHYGGPGHRRAAAIKAALRRALYPDTDEWKEQIWRQARTVMNQALDGLAG